MRIKEMIKILKNVQTLEPVDEAMKQLVVDALKYEDKFVLVSTLIILGALFGLLGCMLLCRLV